MTPDFPFSLIPLRWKIGDFNRIITGITPFARTGEVSLFVPKPWWTKRAGMVGLHSSPKFLRRRSAEMIVFFGKMERFWASEFRMQLSFHCSSKITHISTKQQTFYFTVKIFFHPKFSSKYLIFSRTYQSFPRSPNCSPDSHFGTVSTKISPQFFF